MAKDKKKDAVREYYTPFIYNGKKDTQKNLDQWKRKKT